MAHPFSKPVEFVYSVPQYYLVRFISESKEVSVNLRIQLFLLAFVITCFSGHSTAHAILGIGEG